MQANPESPTIGVFKGQPWILFDTVAAADFSVGQTDPNGIAIGSNVPAINAAGELVFFNTPGRSKANYPWLTNLDIPGQLAYGMEVWAIAVEIKIPTQITLNQPSPFNVVPQAVKLAEALLQFSVIELNLGQEEQSAWPVTAFGNGGAMWSILNAQNAQPAIECSLKLPEPIAMGRTQNISCKMKIAPFMFPTIGTPTAPGVGIQMQQYSFPSGDTTYTVPEPPFGVQMKLIGRRIKQTQYGASPT